MYKLVARLSTTKPLNEPGLFFLCNAADLLYGAINLFLTVEKRIETIILVLLTIYYRLIKVVLFFIEIGEVPTNILKDIEYVTRLSKHIQGSWTYGYRR